MLMLFSLEDSYLAFRSNMWPTSVRKEGELVGTPGDNRWTYCLGAPFDGFNVSNISALYHIASSYCSVTANSDQPKIYIDLNVIYAYFDQKNINTFFQLYFLKLATLLVLPRYITRPRRIEGHNSTLVLTLMHGPETYIK